MQNVGLGKAECGIASKRLYVGKRSGAQVVHYIDLIAPHQMMFHQM